ncbi:MAG: hypothetical protein RR183_07100 [Bacteroidales bacterium]
MRQAPETVQTYLTYAVRAIDTEFGKGYAKEHPELVSGYIQASSLDMSASMIAKSIQDLEDSIKNKMDEIDFTIGNISVG